MFVKLTHVTQAPERKDIVSRKHVHFLKFRLKTGRRHVHVHKIIDHCAWVMHSWIFSYQLDFSYWVCFLIWAIVIETNTTRSIMLLFLLFTVHVEFAPAWDYRRCRILIFHDIALSCKWQKMWHIWKVWKRHHYTQ